MRLIPRLLGLLPTFSATLALASSVVAPPPPSFAPGFVSLAHTAFVTEKKARIDLWRLRRERGRGGPVDLVMALTPRRAVRIDIALVARRGPSRSLFEHAACPNALAMINGSFFEGEGQSERVQGLLRLDKHTLQPPTQRAQGGFLATDGESLAIIPRDSVTRAETAKNAIESSPILALDGENGMWRDDGVRANRVAAGVTAKGDVVLIGAFGAHNDAVSLYEFEALAESAVAANDVKLKDLIAMDGGPSAHLYLPRADLFYGQTGPIFLTEAICVGVK